MTLNTLLLYFIYGQFNAMSKTCIYVIELVIALLVIGEHNHTPIHILISQLMYLVNYY